MAKKSTPATRLKGTEESPKVPMPRSKRGLVLKGKKKVIPPPERDGDGLPILPQPKGVKKSPVRSLTEKQMAREERERGGVSAELQRTRKDP